MKKSTILSGKPASGKTWITMAIENQYDKNRILRIRSIDFFEKMENEYAEHAPINLCVDLIIVECCGDDAYMDIILIQEHIKRINTEFVNPWTNTRTTPHSISVVFQTILDIKQKDQYKDFHVINCNYDNLPF